METKRGTTTAQVSAYGSVLRRAADASEGLASLGFSEQPEPSSFPILSTGPRPPVRKVEHFYEVGVLSDETTVAALRCGHVAYGVTAEQTYALCDWCPWEAS